jgi:hypothetical protein
LPATASTCLPEDLVLEIDDGDDMVLGTAAPAGVACNAIASGGPA